jgi:shikimate dehydrogenase
VTTFLSALTGSFSQGAGNNPTVSIMEAGFEEAHMDVRYINCEVAPEHLANAVKGAIAMGWLGFNCSLPHKETVLEHLDSVGESARLIGAVNTVVIRDGQLTGENTDGKGFVEALRTQRDPRGARAVIFGAGGAARAIAIELGLAGAASITIVNRTAERGQALAEHVDHNTEAECSFTPWGSQFRIPGGCDLVVNATSIGFSPQEDQTLDVDFSAFPTGAVVADVVPNPPMTRWLRAAQDAGCIPLTGVGMLVNQALVNAKLWTGETLDATVMHRAFEEALGI